MIQELTEATHALDTGQFPAALAGLLAAWNEKKHPRIADLIDRVSARIPGPKIPTKTVKARTAAWTEIAKRVDPADVGALLAVPWPGTWKNAKPLVELICAFPPDPRIAVALAHLSGDDRYDTWTAEGLYTRILRRVDFIGDPRTLPILESVAAKPMSHWYDKYSRPTLDSTIWKVRSAGVPVLGPHEDAAIAAVEARFAEAISEDRTEAKGRADFLAAIYADPDDDAPRTVFADWLTEQGDPLGEFISIQLAHAQGRTSDESKKRERQLQKKHGKAWAGAIHAVIDKTSVVFERGFLAQVSIDLRYKDKVGPIFDDPAWATVHTVAISFGVRYAKLVVPLFDKLARVRRWLSVEPQDIIAIALKPRPAIVELDVDLVDVANAELVAAMAAIPNLRRLGISSRTVAFAEPIVDAIAGKLERLTTPYPERFGELVRFAERKQLDIDLCVGHATVWGTLRDRHLRVSSLPHGASLVAALEGLRPGDLTAVSVSASSCDYDAAEIQKVETQLARFPGVTVEVPWPRLGPKSSAEPLIVRGWCESEFDEAAYRDLWAFVGQPPFSLSFDAMAINDGAHTPFKGDGLAEVLEKRKKKRTKSVHVYRSAEQHVASLSLSEKYFSIHTPYRDVATAFEVIERLRDRLPVVSIAVPFVESKQRRTLYGLRENLEWMMFLDEKFAPLLERAGEFPWLHVRRIGKQIVIATSDRPSQDPTPEQVRALDLVLAELAWRAKGFSLPAIVEQVLGPVIEDAGFVRGAETDYALGGASYTAGNREIRIWIDSPEQHQCNARIGVYEAEQSRQFSYLYSSSPKDANEARDVLRDFASRFDVEVLAYFSDEPTTPPSQPAPQ